MRASSKFALPGGVWLLNRLGNHARGRLRTGSYHSASTSCTDDCSHLPEKERLYGKDGECPQEWAEWLSSAGLIPSSLLFNGSDDVLKYMPESAKVQTLMYYLGIGDTFTPFHKDLCGSSGQNLMCYTEESGSSFWFMTEGSSAPAVADYLHKLDHELDLESHVLTVEELEKAPFDVYIAEQNLGDLILVPSRSCHQVVNHGGVTVKTSWSRMTVDNLSTALYHELPIYRRVCRPEIYRVKTNIYYALLQYTKELEHCSKIEEYPSETLLVALQEINPNQVSKQN
ncbi:hypothetical protein SERLA73DRAFT_64406 [Serpula lacrymans var. lacrymans S7.3]|uniref:JmjC domain-containing protein n=1 Tax=Serpula lacrymans var. lacrymans (strain S7.3) TaxID=936435 RepID=F8QEQ9_SERL3|nr:hypothetical protein SERLA73DRAFT_64406 [Serpula lacrymans var. lacrymans S7.3]